MLSLYLPAPDFRVLHPPPSSPIPPFPAPLLLLPSPSPISQVQFVSGQSPRHSGALSLLQLHLSGVTPTTTANALLLQASKTTHKATSGDTVNGYIAGSVRIETICHGLGGANGVVVTSDGAIYEEQVITIASATAQQQQQQQQQSSSLFAPLSTVVKRDSLARMRFSLYGLTTAHIPITATAAEVRAAIEDMGSTVANGGSSGVTVFGPNTIEVLIPDLTLLSGESLTLFIHIQY